VARVAALARVSRSNRQARVAALARGNVRYVGGRCECS
jgi:hypothetical protein